MYTVRYFMTAGTRTRKSFSTLHEAIRFSVYKVAMDNLYEISKD